MIFLYILAVIIAILLLLIAFAPKKYNVHRSITIQKVRPEVFQYLKLMRNQDHWSPWMKRDPGMKQTFTGEDGNIGFMTQWESDHKQVGHGEQEIVKLEENRRIESALRFLKPWKSESSGYFDLQDLDGGTKVTWVFHGTNKPPMNVMMLFYNMDKAVGKDFEEGLAQLKKVLED
jgi:uncharacterized protein YndB with AHSA1/START domain